MTFILRSLLLIILLWSIASINMVAKAQFSFKVESGIATAIYNDIAIPGTTGTKYSLCNELETKPTWVFRTELLYRINSSSSIRMLVAPLKLTGKGVLSKDILFKNTVFQKDAPLESVFKFNSYRISYTYEIKNTSRFITQIGITGKIRDAKISLAAYELYEEKTDLGFVPLIYFRVAFPFSNGWFVNLEGDALAAPSGRAEDIAVSFSKKLNKSIHWWLAYRFLEGGANAESVYTFSYTQYFVSGFWINF